MNSPDPNPTPTPMPPLGPPPEHFPAPWASDWGQDPFGLWQALTYQGARQGFRWIPPMREPFLMGSPEGEHDRRDNERQHEVLLSPGFWLAETVCTQALWQAVMGRNPSRFKGEARPVERVSWHDVQGFVKRMNGVLDAAVQRALARPVLSMERLGGYPVGRSSSRTDPGLGEAAVWLKPDLQANQWPEHQDSGQPYPRLRLPTEAEWEYACRAGTPGPFSFGDDITPEQANYDGDSPYRRGPKGLNRQETVEVASLPPNPWGLYEMHGNVWEWCQDWFAGYPDGLVTNPMGPASGVGRVLRGGGWFFVARDLRSAYRDHNDPGNRNLDCGFRLALGPELGQASQAGGERDRTARARSER